MSNNEQFHDPVLDRNQDSRGWYLRRAFALAFYESNEDVGIKDWFMAYGVFFAILFVVLCVSMVTLVATTGSVESVMAMDTLYDPMAYAEAIVGIIAAIPVVGGFAVTWKLLRGGFGP